MKRKKVENKSEENIVTSMITSTEFLSQTATVLDIKLLRGSHFQLIADWCIQYFNKYHKAPGKHIENRYHSWVHKGEAGEEMVDAVSDVLEKLSDNYEQTFHTNVPYLLDEASEYISARKLEVLRDDLDSALVQNDISTAENVLNSFRTSVLGSSRGIDTFRDTNAFKTAFNASQKPLFTIGTGNTKNFFAYALCRDNLIGVLGREKIGKTFWCTEFAYRALTERKKVALFEVGDLSESQILKRIAVRFSGRPMYKKYCGNIRVPIRIRKINKDVRIRSNTKLITKPANMKSTLLAMQKFSRRYHLSSEQCYFMISVHSNYSVNVADINRMLDKWAIERDFIPDVIIIDYPDILADEPNTNNYTKRDKENVKWMALRRLSQDRHCLVIVPTQANAKSYDTETLSESNFSEDKRKLAHVTGMMGLNQTREEKEREIMRLNWIVLREAPFSIDHCLYVGQCLKLGKAFCCGYYR